MLSRLGLELHPDKTKIARAEKGFDFLGMHFRLQPVRKESSRLKESCRIWPSDKSLERVRKRIRVVVGRRYSLSLEEMIAELNPVIRGWNNYHNIRGTERKRRLKLNVFVRERLRIFLRRKYNDASRGAKRVLDKYIVGRITGSLRARNRKEPKRLDRLILICRTQNIIRLAT